MFGREPNFLHVVKLLGLPGEPIVLPLLGTGEREPYKAEAQGQGWGGWFWLEEALNIHPLPTVTSLPSRCGWQDTFSFNLHI